MTTQDLEKRLKSVVELLQADDYYPSAELVDDAIEALAAQRAEIEALKGEVDNVKQVEFPRKVKAVADGWAKKIESRDSRIQQLEAALQQLLDDMGDTGHCVCEAAKQQAQSAIKETGVVYNAPANAKASGHSLHRGFRRLVDKEMKVTDEELRAMWRSKGGKFHGPRIETGTMPESQLLPFLRELMTLPEKAMLVQPDAIKAGGQYPENVWKAAQRLAYKLGNMTPSNALANAPASAGD